MELWCIIVLLIKDCTRLKVAGESNFHTSFNTSQLTVLWWLIASTGLVRHENISLNFVSQYRVLVKWGHDTSAKKKLYRALFNDKIIIMVKIIIDSNRIALEASYGFFFMFTFVFGLLHICMYIIPATFSFQYVVN